MSGYAEAKGVSLNFDAYYQNFSAKIGGTIMDVSRVENNQRFRQEFQERYTIVWNLTHHFKKTNLKIEYTGNLYGPMVLPLLGNLDPRMPISKPFSIQNIQVTKIFKNNLELFGGVKNLLNWTPNKGNPFIIARTQDPFDQHIQYNSAGEILATPENPHALKFDPDYIYGSNQGIRLFLGLRYKIAN